MFKGLSDSGFVNGMMQQNRGLCNIENANRESSHWNNVINLFFNKAIAVTLCT